MAINNKKAVYIAVLNQHDIHDQLSERLLGYANQTDYEVCIVHSSLKPITQNRNKVVQDFLSKPEYDYLVMFDSDNVPPVDFLNLVDFQLDIVGSLYFGYQKGMIVPWCLERGKDGLFTIVDLKGKRGLIECDAVGTGAIVIKRSVLEDEKLKFPFRNEYDADGIKLLGLDINFCKRAKEVGYKVYCHLDYISGHWVPVDLKDVFALLIEKEGLEEKLKLLQGEK
jgi:hypothetical protein